MKIVINTCYGGFGLSEKVIQEYFNLKGWTLYTEKNEIDWVPTYWKVPVEDRVKEIDWKNSTPKEIEEYNRKYIEQTFYNDDVERTDSDLIRAIEIVGTEEASGKYASLKIVEIPDDVEWELGEYDGREWVAEKHRTWR